MSDSLSIQLAELREAFDRSFAEPPARQGADLEDLLAVKVARRRYVLRLRQVAGLVPDRPVTPLPGPVPALLGVAGFSGSTVAVYDLAAVLGHGTAQDPRWLVLTRGAPVVALAFDDLDGHLRVPGDAVVEHTGGRAGERCVRGMVPRPDGSRPVVDVPAVVQVIRGLTGHPHSNEEP